MTELMSRRDFIYLVGKTAGAGAAYNAMIALGLMTAPSVHARPPELPSGSGAGTTVLILGAGIAGMVLAYELRKVGYDCTVLEARSRAGGRVLTLRAGDVVEETDSAQRVEWDSDPHMYFNAGAARIPHHHQGILHYCRELDVPVEVLVNENRSAFLQDDSAFGGKPQIARAVVNDARGFVAELAAKAVNQQRLDRRLSKKDKERLLDFLKDFGALDVSFTYKGSERSGYAVPPGAGMQQGRIKPPIKFEQLLSSDFWHGKVVKMNYGEHYPQSASMLQIVGGMDKISDAFARSLGSLIKYDAEVTQIRKTETGAEVVWKDRKRNGATAAVQAAYVVCTIPLPVLRNIAADFRSDVRTAVAAVPYVPAAKLAFQAERRFWELDHQIYGGISWTSRDIKQIWYPSAGLHQKKGILVGGYIWDDGPGAAFAARSPSQRINDALVDGEHVHTNYRAFVGKGITVAWSKIPWSLGGWADWSGDPGRRQYKTLLAGDGPILFCGEHMSYLNAWQEGAVLSAFHCIGELAARVREKRL
jgi:monoamine oxidase